MPYGERHANSSLATSGNPFLYNGKESQKSFGVNYIDSEARFQRLDGAFNSIDPKTEETYWISPYSYCNGNPIKLTDKNGERAKIAINHKNKIITIYANIYINSKTYSSKELQGLTKDIRDDINTAWNSPNWTYNNNGTEYNVKFEVEVESYRKNKNDGTYANFITIDNVESSFVKDDSYNGTWNPNHNNYAHEFGHIVGLTDKYNNIKDEFNNIKSIPFDGWDDNIMGVSKQPVQQRNIDAILAPIFEQINNMNWLDKLLSNDNLFYINGIRK